MIFNGFTYDLGILQKVETKILWVNICAQDIEGVAISIINGGGKDIQNTKSE